MTDEARFSKYDYTTAGTETNMQELLEKAVKECEKKRLAITCKKTESIVVGKRKVPGCGLWIGEVKIMEVWKFKYLGSALLEDEK